MTFTERVQSITQDKLLPGVVDIVLNSNILALRLMAGSPKMWSGETLKKPIKFEKSTTGGSFSGLDTFSTSTTDNRERLSFDPRGYYQSVVIPGIEKAVNQTDAQVLALVKTELESAQQDMVDSIGTLFYSDGTGNSSKDFLGLGAIVDDGTSVSTYGGLSRTTYTGLQATVTASGGTMTLAKLATLMSNASAAGSSRERPTLIVSSQTIWDLYESLLTPTVRSNYQMNGFPRVGMRYQGMVDARQGAAGQQGFVAVTYRGVPWVADEKATSQIVFMLNENYLDWYTLKDSDLQSISLGSSTVEGVYAEVPSKLQPFMWTGFKTPVNQYGEVGQIIALGNLISWNPRRHAKLTGVTGV